MKANSVIVLICLILMLAFLAISTMAAPIGTSFTYQGKLTDASGAPLSGSYNMDFKLFDAVTVGNQIGTTVSLAGVLVSGGLFTVPLDFGASAFTGQKRWLETVVAGQTVSPRVEITSVPSAVYAQAVADGSITSGDIAAGALNSYSGNIQALASTNVNPTVVGSVTTNGVPQSLAVSGKYVYVTSNGGNNYSLQVVDVSNPASPITVGIGCYGVGTDLQQITVSGGFAYATNTSNRRLRVIDISNPYSPAFTGYVATSSSGTNPTAIAISGRYAYVTATAGTRFQSVDVSNPASPVIVGAGTSGPAGGDALRSVVVFGRYAYAVDSTGNRLYIFDISNPASLTAVGNVVTGTAPYAVAVSGRFAYVVNSGSNTLQVIDVSNVAAPAILGSVATGNTPYSVAASGRYVCVVNNGSNTIQVFDVLNPASPSLVGSVATGSGPCSIAISGRYAYVANSTSNTMQVIDITGIESTAVNAHSLEAGTLQVRGSGVISGQLSVVGGLNVGKGGLFSLGGIATSGAGYIGGNLGVGAQSPTQKLQVDSGDILVRGSSNFGAPGNEAKLYLGDTNNYIKAVYGGSLRLGTNGTDDISLSGDKVGVGTTGPLAKLQVEGSEYSDTDNLYGPLAVKETTNNVDTPDGRTVLGLKRIGKSGAAYDNSVAFQLKRYATSGTPAFTQMDILLGNGYTCKPDVTVMSLLGNGNVGIGTTSPNEKLSVLGSIKVDQGDWNDGTFDSGGVLKFGNGATGEGIASKRTSGGNWAGIDFYTGSTIRMTVANGGNVGIGTTSPSYKLDVNGTIRGSNVNPSDARFKTNVQTLGNALDYILCLRGVSFEWKPGINFGEGRQLGFIAQEVEQIIPELVSTDNEGYKAVAYEKLVPVLVEAIKTQQQQMDTKDARINDLEARLERIEKLIGEHNEK